MYSVLLRRHLCQLYILSARESEHSSELTYWIYLVVAVRSEKPLLTECITITLCLLLLMTAWQRFYGTANSVITRVWSLIQSKACFSISNNTSTQKQTPLILNMTEHEDLKEHALQLRTKAALNTETQPGTVLSTYELRLTSEGNRYREYAV
jgi:hypothetical protein